jgi:glycerol-3-phosphate dehydrogenase (NAD(P)+)
MKKIKTISIIGDGGWGTTLAIHLAKKKHPVVLWGAFADYVAEVEKTRESKKFLPGYRIPASVELTSDLSYAISSGDLIILASPSEYLTDVLKKIKTTPYQGKVFLSVVKGIHPISFKRMSEIIKEELGPVSLAVLSGPTIAGEVAAGLATTAVIACRQPQLVKQIQNIIHSETFRIYTNNDVPGTEIGGSIKNVIAIACGVCDGLGLGTNAKAAVLTRGLAEITRLGIALGGKKETFYGLTGLGDLVTTCVSPKSRNRSVGEALGQGVSIKKVLGSMSMVAEGVITSKAVYRLSKKMKIPMPISEQVYKIVFEGKNPRKAMEDLMTRQAKAENNT